MNHLSIFTTCKPMVGLDAIHQDNAIRSWLALFPLPRIIVYGDDDGVAELCAKYRLLHLPNAHLTTFGRPDLAWMLSQCLNFTPAGVVPAYVNADICLTQDFVNTIFAIKVWYPKFMICGQRHNLDVNQCVEDFDDLRQRAIIENKYLKPTGTDYFAFSSSRMADYLPAGLGVGHLAWDNYLPWHAVTKHGATFIDATRTIVAVHQNHPETNFDGHPGAMQNHRIVKSIVPPELHATCGLQLPQALKW